MLDNGNKCVHPTEMLSRFDKSIQCRSYGTAKQILSLEMLSHIEKSFRNKSSPVIGVEVDKNVLSGHVFEALSRLTAAIPEANQPVNPFVSLCLSDNLYVNQTSNLEMEFTKKPVGNGKKYVAKAWYDGQEKEIMVSGGKYKVESPTLVIGNHSWRVKTYLVDAKVYDSTKNTLEKSKSESTLLEDRYAKETDPVKKQLIQVQSMVR